MSITLYVFLFFVTSLHADDIATSKLTSTIGSSSLSSANTSSSSSLIDVEEELAKIRTTCLTPQDFELLTGNAIRYYPVGWFIHALIEQSVATIGLEELRTTLKLSALPPWKPFNLTEPSEHELASATTIEEYYNLREPRSKMRSLSSIT
uniref:Secreted protein n=1 Tax=Bursaphelenchus xylophilus TaxID=6326 RepID=A0A1I7S599_BURXY